MTTFKLESSNHHVEFEHSVLGQLMLDFKLIETASDVIRPNDFTDEKARHVYLAMMNAFRDGMTYLDVVDLRTYLIKTARFDLVGHEFIMMLQDRNASSHDFERHLAKVQENARRTAISETLNKHQEMGVSQDRDPKNVIEEIVDELTQIQQDGFFELKTADEREVPEIEQMAKDAINGALDQGISTDLRCLDDLVMGFQPKKLYIVAGRPSMGKSALGVHFALAAALKEKSVLFASLEMPSKDVVMRMFGNRGGVGREQIMKGLSTKEVERFTTVKHEGWNKKILVLDNANSVSSIRRVARRMDIRRDRGLDMIVVDYLQLMRADGNSQNRVYEVEEISRRLKAMAREFNVPVIALSQINREAEKRDGHKPLLSDLRDSGSIEQDADVVMLLFREDYYRPEDQHDGMMEVNVAKNREGKTGRKQLRVDFRFNRFSDPEL